MPPGVVAARARRYLAGGASVRGACGRRLRGVSEREQKGNLIWEVAVDTKCAMPDTIEELRALERAVEREWWWLHGALNAVAQVQAERSRGTL